MLLTYLLITGTNIELSSRVELHNTIQLCSMYLQIMLKHGIISSVQFDLFNNSRRKSQWKASLNRWVLSPVNKQQLVVNGFSQWWHHRCRRPRLLQLEDIRWTSEICRPACLELFCR